MMHGIGADLRLAVRSLRAAPAVTIAAALTLTFGVGATTAVFSISNGLTLRPLPVRNPQDLVTITSDTALRFGFQAGAGWTYAMWDQLQQRAGAFDGAFAWNLQRMDLSEGGEMDPVNTLVASGSFFETLGVRAAIGRTFTADDDVRGGGPAGAVAVIGHDLWQRRFGGRQDVLGSRLLVERVPVTIVGVAPQSFKGVDVAQPFDVAIPFGTEALVRGQRSLMNSKRLLMLTAMLRLKPGQGRPEATAALRGMQPDIVGADAPAFLQEPFVLVDASRGISDRSGLRQRYQYPLAVLSIVAGIVLVIVCVNIANLLLSRASARKPELSVRLALGAPRWRLGRLYLIEALLLGSAGAAGGLVFAMWTGRVLVASLPFAGGPVLLDIPIDWRVCAFTAGVAIAAVGLFGTVPAVYAMRVAPIAALRDAGRAAGGRRNGVLSTGLLVAQVALSLVLLAAAGLFVRTMNRLVSVPLGFDPAGMLVASVNMARSTAGASGSTAIEQSLLDAATTVPGVAHAAGSLWTPIGGGGGGVLTDARGRRAGNARQAAFNAVTPGWFATYGTPFKMGRDFDAGDGPNAPRVAIVNEAFRRSVMADAPSLGSTIHACDGCTVVGVVADAVYGQSLRDAAPPIVYFPLAQSAGVTAPDAPFRISIRAAGDPASVTAGLTARFRAIDSGLTFTFKRLEQDLDASVAQERLLAMLSGFFGAIALLLSSVGLYGVSSYAATRRRAEIGIRLALGGQPRAVVRAILDRIVLLVLVGAAAGLGAAWWLARFIAPLLYGLDSHDPATLVASAAMLVAVGTLAAWIPASLAARSDPAQVLRQV